MKNTLKATLSIIGIGILIFIFSFGSSSTEAKTETIKYNVCSTIEDTISVQDTSKYVILDTARVIIDNDYTEIIMNHFVEDAIQYGLDSIEVMNHIKMLDAILIANLSEDNNLGATVYKKDSLSPTGIRGMILIDYSLLKNFDLYALTLYHELGHWFGLDHCGCDKTIMMDSYNKTNTYAVLSEWEKNVKKLIKEIHKESYDKKTGTFNYPDIIESGVEISNFKSCSH